MAVSHLSLTRGRPLHVTSKLLPTISPALSHTPLHHLCHQLLHHTHTRLHLPHYTPSAPEPARQQPLHPSQFLPFGSWGGEGKFLP